MKEMPNESVPNVMIDSVNNSSRLGDEIATAKRAQAGVWMDARADVSAIRDLKPGMSVAVCTLQRPLSLLTFLRSLERQERRPDQLVIVDASPGPDSEAVVLQDEAFSKWADEVVYFRVAGQLRGLTRQRNLALQLADRDLIAFFDDDVVLDEGCLKAMEQTMKARSDVVGMGAMITNANPEPGLRWKLMRAFRAIPDLVPGRYHRSGFSIPVGLLKNPKGAVEVGRLQGAAMLWRTTLARQLGFATLFTGYSQSEDVEFSRRAAAHGRLLVCSEARLEHHNCPLGRPNLRELARMGILNRYYIQRTTLVDFSWRDLCRFGYANFIFTTILTADYLRRCRFADAAEHLLGSMLGVIDAASWSLTQRRTRPVQVREQMQTTPSVPQPGSTDHSRNREVLSLSVCIATHERPLLLAKTLAALARQTRPAGEVIISDSSASVTSSALVADFARQHPGLRVRRVASQRSALPWQRWWAFSHSQGDVVLFLDDDIELRPETLQMLRQTYEDLDSKGGPERVAGVGFVMSFADNSRKERRPFSFEERWLKTSALPSASVLPGGTTIPPKLEQSDGPVRVHRLCGGAMSFRREVLAKIGPLERLYELYENRLGRGEDAVLSWYAGKQGALYIVTQALAIHPLDEQAKCSAYAVAGWRLGMTETWGRAHTMRWMAVSRSALWSEWCRVATLEILRAVWWGLLKNPFRGNNWSRFAGAVCGTIRTLAEWKSIPATASGPSNNSCTLVPQQSVGSP